ncbi:MAG: hypothetical protein Q9182_004365 [Xanthomendoza sp. 2 TL-2023]
MQYIRSPIDSILRSIQRLRDSDSKRRQSHMTSQLELAVHPQLDSPLFKIPPELRSYIFQLALTACEDLSRPYQPNAYNYRPGITCALKIDTNLLLTCRRVYFEAHKIPPSINEQISWYHRQPPGINNGRLPTDDRLGSVIRRRHLKTIHVFAQQVWLEGPGFASFTTLWDHACPTTLIITLRHSDWWWWESEALLALDPKQEGRASVTEHSRPADPFHSKSWGNQFQNVRGGLQKLQMELETVEKKQRELDEIVERAKGWEFQLGNGRLLLLNKSKMRRTGWTGALLDTSNEGEQDFDVYLMNEDIDNRLGDPPAMKARERLEAKGVVFDEAGSVKGLPAHKTCTYYVVTLTWEASAFCPRQGYVRNPCGCTD